MVKGARCKFTILCCVATLMLALVCSIVPASVRAQEKTAQPATAPSEKIFPGLNEVVPQATLVATKIHEAQAQVLQAEIRDKVYQTLTDLVERLQELEERYSDWQEINSWQFSRMRTAQGSYAELSAEQKVQLDIIYSQLRILEELRSAWEREKAHWHPVQVHPEWYTYCRHRRSRSNRCPPSNIPRYRPNC